MAGSRIAIATTCIAATLFVARGAFARQPPPPPPAPQDDTKIGDKYDEAKEGEEKGARAPAREATDPSSQPPKKEDEDDPDEKRFTLSGYVETFYQWNFNHPSNGISNNRGYDTRHNALTIGNAVIDAGYRTRDVIGRIAVQAGHTPAAYYGQETRLPGTDSAGETGPELWRHLQRASVGWQASKVVLVEGGLFLTGLGIESMAVKDNWTWSRSNASTRLPNYHTGAKGTFELSKSWHLATGVFNGWNNVVDNNDEKSVMAQATYKHEEDLTAAFTYFGGVEREGGAEEGRAWRHTGHAFVEVDATSWFELAGETSGGWEATRFGTHWFASTAAYARVKMLDFLYAAVRGDRVFEDAAANDAGTSQAILFPTKHVTSATATLDARPVKGISGRLELRHDVARDDLYFRGEVQGSGSSADPYVPNAKTQTSLLVGAVAWF